MSSARSDTQSAAPGALAAAARPTPPPKRQAVRTGQGLANRLLWLTLPFVVVFVVITQTILGYIAYRESMTTLQTHAEVTTQLTGEAIAGSLWRLDSPVYRAQLTALNRDPVFLGAELRDETGALLEAIGQIPSEQLELRSASGSDTRIGDGVIRADLDILDPVRRAETIGQLRLWFTTDELARQTETQLVIGGIACLLLCVGFAAINQGSIRTLVLKPLDRLLDAMDEVAAKRWTHVAWSSQDEIGQACGAFNRMVDGLRSGDEAKRLLTELQQAQAALQSKHAQLTHANGLILDSVRYARNIQTGILPDLTRQPAGVVDMGLLWEPLQIVGGDYCWFETLPDGRALFFMADCTGHGVPGAFMTLIVASALDQALHQTGMRHSRKGDAPEQTAGGRTNASAVLLRLDQMVRTKLHQDGADGDSDDGLEAALCLYDPRDRTLQYAGVGISLLYTEAISGAPVTQLSRIRADRSSLGYRSLPGPTEITDHMLTLPDQGVIHLITDGVTDHMGGTPRRLLGRKAVQTHLESVLCAPIADQHLSLSGFLKAYRQAEPRRDDMTVLSVRFGAETEDS